MTDKVQTPVKDLAWHTEYSSAREKFPALITKAITITACSSHPRVSSKSPIPPQHSAAPARFCESVPPSAIIACQIIEIQDRAARFFLRPQQGKRAAASAPRRLRAAGRYGILQRRPGRFTSPIRRQLVTRTFSFISCLASSGGWSRGNAVSTPRRSRPAPHRAAAKPSFQTGRWMKCEPVNYAKKISAGLCGFTLSNCSWSSGSSHPYAMLLPPGQSRDRPPRGLPFQPPQSISLRPLRRQLQDQVPPVSRRQQAVNSMMYSSPRRRSSLAGCGTSTYANPNVFSVPPKPTPARNMTTRNPWPPGADPANIPIPATAVGPRRSFRMILFRTVLPRLAFSQQSHLRRSTAVVARWTLAQKPASTCSMGSLTVARPRQFNLDLIACTLINASNNPADASGPPDRDHYDISPTPHRTFFG